MGFRIQNIERIYDRLILKVGIPILQGPDIERTFSTGNKISRNKPVPYHNRTLSIWLWFVIIAL